MNIAEQLKVQVTNEQVRLGTKQVPYINAGELRRRAGCSVFSGRAKDGSAIELEIGKPMGSETEVYVRIGGQRVAHLVTDPLGGLFAS